MDTNQNSVYWRKCLWIQTRTVFIGENVYVYTPEQCLLEKMFMYTNLNMFIQTIANTCL